MKTNRSSFQFMLVAGACGAALAVLQCSAGASASTVYDGFNYSALSNGADIVGTTTTGTGLTGKFTGVSDNANSTYTYQSTGLTFANLQTSGGAVSVSTSYWGVLSEQLSTVPGAGSYLYGGYLVDPTSVNGNTSGVIPSNTHTDIFTEIGSSGSYASGEVASYSKYYGNGTDHITGAVGSGSLGNAGVDSGTALTIGTTYLVLFGVSNVNGTSGGSKITQWILNSAQFAQDEGNLTASYLNGLATGTGAGQIQQIGSYSTTSSIAINSTDDHLSVGLFRGFTSSAATFDEIRLSYGSGSSLAAVAPTVVPVPATASLMGVGALGLLLLRRRNRATV